MKHALEPRSGRHGRRATHALEPRSGRHGRRATHALAGAAAAAVVATVIPTVLPIFSGGGATWMLAAVGVPVAIAAVSGLASRTIDRPWVRAAADLVAVVVLLALMPADPEGRAALHGLASGPKLLINAALPAAPAGPELGTVVVVLAFAAWVSAEVALQSETSLLPLVPPAVVYVAALALGAGGLPPPRWGALVVAGGAGATLALRRALTERPLPLAGPSLAGARRSRFGVPFGQLGAGAAVLAVAVAVAVPLGSNLPGNGARQPYDLRAALSAAPRPEDQLSLLSNYAATYDAPVAPAMSVRESGADARTLWWRMATYDHFTGTLWTTDNTFQRAGLVLPPAPGTRVKKATVRAEVNLNHPAGYLPAPDRPVRVSVPGLDVSASDGLLAVPAGSAPTLRYRVVSTVAQPDTQQLLAAAPAPLTDPAAAPVPPEIAALAHTIIAGGGSSAFSRLTAISAYLRGPGFTRQPAGHSSIGSGTYQVVQMLHTRNGSAEQYASAFALLARAIGFDSRVAVGYSGGTVDAGTGTVVFTNRDLMVWPEVKLAGIGWQPFPATPAATAAGRGGPAPPQSGLSKALQEQQQLNTQGPPATVHTPQPPEKRPVPSLPGTSWLPVAIGLAVGLPAAVVAGVALAKLARRRRQRARPDTSRRVLGAWEFVLDRLAELGVAVGAAATSSEVVHRATAALGPACATPLSALAETVDATRFDRRFPPVPPVAEAAWREAAAFDRYRRKAIPRLRRMRLALSPAPWRR